MTRIHYRGRSLLNTICSGALRSALALVVSTACLQVAIAKQDAGENKAGVESVGVGSNNNSAQERRFRLRSFTLEPGGIAELHSLKDRPTVLHIIRGTLISHPQGVVLRPGVGLTQDQGNDFWIENTGSEPAEFIWLPVDRSSP